MVQTCARIKASRRVASLQICLAEFLSQQTAYDDEWTTQLVIRFWDALRVMSAPRMALSKAAKEKQEDDFLSYTAMAAQKYLALQM